MLATQLGVTRGSFYWHFRDREDLLRRVLQAWVAESLLHRQGSAANREARRAFVERFMAQRSAR